jgi:uncharacterized protein DUF1963
MMLRGGVILCVLLSLSGAVASAASAADVRERAKAAGYGDIAGRLADTALQTEYFRPAKTGMPAALGTSRLGGDPDLPAHAAWPRCHGKPQSFLAQVRVHDLPDGARELRRVGGVLLFFTFVEFEPGETEYPWDAGRCSAVLHARPGANLARVKGPLKRTLRLKPVSLRFAERPDVPDLALDADHLMPPLQDIVPAGGWEKWFDFHDALHGKPFVETRVLGYPGAPNGGNRCWDRADRGKDTWRHLFTMGPDDEFGFEVADAGRLQLLISPADLRGGRFNHVCGVFDSA